MDAKCLHHLVANFCSNKPYSKHVHLRLFALLHTMHNDKQGLILLYISQPTNHICIAKIKIVNIQHSIFFGHVIQDWKVVYEDFTLINVKCLEILSSFVAYWVALLMACPNHAPSKGMGKLNASHEITNFSVVVMFAKLIPSSST